MSELADAFNGDRIMELFKDEINSIDEKLQIGAIKRISTIAKALGPQKTRTDLIPYLNEYLNTKYCYEELLLNLAEQLGDFVQYLGEAKHAVVLLDIFEKLSSSDEVSVCDQTVASLCKIADNLSDTIMEDIYMGMIKKMIAKDWFTTKCAALGLFKACYGRVCAETKDELRAIYLSLCSDDSPMVRRYAAMNLPSFIKLLTKELVTAEFLPAFIRFTKDDQDSVRELSIDIAVALGSVYTDAEIQEHVLVHVQLFARDSSWKIRQQYVTKLPELQLSLGSDITRQHLVVILKNLAHDDETNVREAIAKIIVTFCINLQKSFGEEANLDPVIRDDIFPIIKDLHEDYSEFVQESLSHVITDLSDILTPLDTKEFILPIIIETIQNNVNKLKEHYINNLNKILSIIGFEDLGVIIEDIMIELLATTTSVWRSRRCLVVTIHKIATSINEAYFTTHVVPHYHKLLSDSVFSVRRTAIIILPQLIKTYGMAWAKRNLLFSIFNYSNHTHYLYRYICLFCIDEMIKPTMQNNNKSYINIKHKSDYLYKINYLNELLIKKLETSDFIEGDTHTNFNDCIETYAENTLDIIEVDDFWLVSDKEETYLEDLLVLLIRYGLEIIKNLTGDKIENVKLRSLNTLGNVLDLQIKLGLELQETWVLETIETCTDQINLKKLIDDKLNQSEDFMEQDIDHVDHGTSFEKKFFKSIDSLISNNSVTSCDYPFADAKCDFDDSTAALLVFGTEERLVDDGTSIYTDFDDSNGDLETELLDILDKKMSVSKDNLDSIDV